MQVVRGLAWLDSPAGAIATGAEDGQLCLWVPQDAQPDAKHAKKRRK